jgi:type III pantothenate kinase
MKLLLDIGNTRIKWAYAGQDDAAQLQDAGDFLHRDVADPGRFVEQLPYAPAGAAAVNVGGTELGGMIAERLAASFGCKLELITTSAAFGEVSNGYVSPEQLGADRWAAVVAARARCRQACCIVDAGSATTIDLLAATGRHLGGLILPGLRLMQSALRADTSDIDRFASRGKPLADEEWIGRDTASAISRGSVFATIQTIKGAVREFPETDVEPLLIVTGGEAPLLMRELPESAQHCPLLVLEGVRLLSQGDQEN